MNESIRIDIFLFRSGFATSRFPPRKKKKIMASSAMITPARMDTPTEMSMPETWIMLKMMTAATTP